MLNVENKVKYLGITKDEVCDVKVVQVCRLYAKANTLQAHCSPSIQPTCGANIV